ncbi:Nif3-like dinuclear metal center hexameric protein [Dellaglioa algida]|uniref:Nif3-like dinuclear metal center hexameric protein n=1 Tax=Dellaglioa algida TaxID=105612 RepID=UPI000BD78DA0|nr:Nif3-like dinuclear metal center hexameric protein [Dellaglioa algida]MDK1718081.1 Nif3-like dinuclear metal center hexameric protein [Dellaglioa algida]MDK1729150.1 Nif3-like dinuclear metal center hexameric protein [Dellaglioa algida]MDK1741584.1 Nif3-like dinuclear metal center hexameric protein [Dellaglioa algida]SOB49663.1 putative GTP cyclohydrolase 1 type 2 [Dellaglioa algida]
MTRISDLIQRFELFAPKNMAEIGDPVGLQLGNMNNKVSKVMTTLDVRPEVVQEAIDNNIDFIFAHHPLMFRPAKNLDTTNPQNKMYADLLSHNITVYAAHTNLDNVVGGMNDWLADQLGLQKTIPLVHTTSMDYGMGRVGNLKNEMTVAEFSEYCKQQFNLSGLRVISTDLTQSVKRVAILGGDGGKFYPEAIKNQADVYVTGDVYYHTAHDMLAEGLSAVDPGHHIESICKPQLKRLFNEWTIDNDWQIETIESTINTDPFQFI